MAKKSIAERILKDHPGFAADVETFDDVELRARLSAMAVELAETALAEEDDDALQEAKATASDLAAPYKDTKKAISLKSRYIVEVLAQRGKA